jgi:outer membrane immunogenic protein
MKYLLAGILAFFAFASVNAAPMTPAAVVSTNWTGFYLDSDAGWRQTSDSWNYNKNPTGVPFSISTSDTVLGGHIGYQQQFNWLVVGAEFGGSSTFSNHLATSIATLAPGAPPCSFGTGSQCQASVGSVMTAGGKLGLAWQDWLIYGIGGGAFNAGVASQVVFAGLPIETSTNATANGYYVGGGIDYMLSKTNLLDLIVGVEYEHIDLGTVQLFSSSNGFLGCTVSINCAQRTISPKEDIVWGKVTVKFNPWGM